MNLIFSARWNFMKHCGRGQLLYIRITKKQKQTFCHWNERQWIPLSVENKWINNLKLEDAISSFLADDFNMKELGAQVMITGSQKALACPPGISVFILSHEAVERIEGHSVKCMYFDLKSALKNGERGHSHLLLVSYARLMPDWKLLIQLAE